ncbi:hypothetical protein D6D10_00834 [Aureobasidium pullulans]|uniref:Uncharacterized protein n=2 Tax=Aureobasidium pullulans TaxID=5580 RepID=A0A4S9F957_AURPU|nr:hypothetical protein D6D10_00834 [Aureobasidium pullulans]
MHSLLSQEPSSFFTQTLLIKMRFLTLAAPVMALLAATASAGVIKRDATSDALLASLKDLTQRTQKLTPVVAAIQSPVGGLLKRQTNPFQPVIDGFQDFDKKAQADIEAMPQTGAPISGDAAQKEVCTAFTAFVAAHQETLKYVIGKSGLLEGIFLGPVAAVLRQHENVLDTFAFGLIDVVDSCQQDATQKKSSLDDTLGKAVCAYTPAGTLGLNLFC